MKLRDLESTVSAGRGGCRRRRSPISSKSGRFVQGGQHRLVILVERGRVHHDVRDAGVLHRLDRPVLPGNTRTRRRSADRCPACSRCSRSSAGASARSTPARTARSGTSPAWEERLFGQHHRAWLVGEQRVDRGRCPGTAGRRTARAATSSVHQDERARSRPAGRLTPREAEAAESTATPSRNRLPNRAAARSPCIGGKTAKQPAVHRRRGSERQHEAGHGRSRPASDPGAHRIGAVRSSPRRATIATPASAMHGEPGKEAVDRILEEAPAPGGEVHPARASRDIPSGVAE